MNSLMVASRGASARSKPGGLFGDLFSPFARRTTLHGRFRCTGRAHLKVGPVLVRLELWRSDGVKAKGSVAAARSDGLRHLPAAQYGLSRGELTTDARCLSKPEGFARHRSRVPTPGASNHSGKARMVEAAGIEPASESVPRKALQA